MRRRLWSMMIRILARMGFFPAWCTSRDDVIALIQALHPREPDVPLMRLGPLGDGGYLVPDCLDGIEACFSPGVNDESGFELDCAQRGMLVFLADGSVSGPAEQHSRFRFEQKYIGGFTADGFWSLDDWFAHCSAEISDDADLLLQMDIEGYEYETLLAVSDDLLRRFRIMVIEFHHLEKFWDREFFVHMHRRVFERLLQTHECVHIHPNNASWVARIGGVDIPGAMEFTFLRRDFVSGHRFRTDFPHQLDADNAPAYPSLPLPPVWYGGSLRKRAETV